MATKIRLQRHGRKSRAIFHIVAVDSRVKRNGRKLEKLGVYNPNVDPASISLDFERALYWVKVGAEMSETARSILSREGVLLKKHLDGGVAKGAFDEKAADKKFEAWLKEKEKSNEATSKKMSDKAEAELKERLAAETKIKEDRAAAIAAKNTPVVEEVEEVAASETEAPAEAAPVEETAPAAETEASAEEVKEEAPAAVEEAPKAEKEEEKAPETEAAEEEAKKEA